MDSCRHMKRITFLGILIIALFLVSGFGCSKQKESAENIIDETQADQIEKSETIIDELKELNEGRVLVDRVRYAQAGNPPFDFINVVFHQKSGNGYKVEVNSDKDVKVEIMTDKDCILKGQGDKYNIISEDEGKEIIIMGEKYEGENRNLCAGATAAGNGQVEIKFKVTELV